MIEKSFSTHGRTLAESGPGDVEDVMVPGARRMEMQIEVSRDGKKIVELFQLIDA